MPVINGLLAIGLALRIRSRAPFVILHRSPEFGIDWVGPWWWVLILPIASLALELTRRSIVFDPVLGNAMTRLLGVTQGLLLAAIVVLIVWNR